MAQVIQFDNPQGIIVLLVLTTCQEMQILVFVAVSCLSCSKAAPAVLSPAQTQFLKDVQARAETESRGAETELLKRLKDVRTWWTDAERWL